MKKMKGFRLLGALFLFFASAATVHAHSALTASSPGDGATVAPPETLSLRFNEPVRLLRLSLTRADAGDVDFDFSPNADARPELAFELPALEPGEYRAQWTVIGSDGHTVSNDFAFTVDPAADEAQLTQSDADDHHHH